MYVCYSGPPDDRYVTIRSLRSSTCMCGTLDLLMTVMSLLGHSDNLSLSMVISLTQAVPIMRVNMKVFNSEKPS